MYFKFLPILMILGSCTYQQLDADLIIHNATIYTVDESWTIAEAVAVKDGKIIAVGPEREILNKYKSEQKIDAKKQFVYPGFIDAHCHFLGYGNSLKNVNLVGTKSFTEVIERIKQHEIKDGFIFGRGWDQNDWEDKNFPTKELLDQNFPEIAVIIDRIDGHATLANSKAMQLAGITTESEIEGGLVVKENGQLTGLFIDRACSLLNPAYAVESERDFETALNNAQKNCFAAGITAVTDAGLPVEIVRIIQQMQASGQLQMNMNVMLSPDDSTEAFMKKGMFVNNKLSVRSVKLYGDGALGSRGAALIEPYSDDHGNHGLILYEQEFFKKWANLCKTYGFQLNTHCIGDSANRELLKIYAEQLEGSNDLRWRIEHAQVVNFDDIEYFGKYNILPSVQPTHATSDMYWAGERLGPERVKTAYNYEALRLQNGMIPLGTDFPVEDIDPIKTFFSAVFRQDLSGFPEEGFQMEGALSREHALRGMTIWAAMAAFEEDKRGSIEVGKNADFVILNLDLMKVTLNQFKNIEVQNTLVDGKQVYPIN